MAAIAPGWGGPPCRAGREPGSLRGGSQLRSERGAGVAAGVVSVEAAGAADLSVVVLLVVLVVDESVGAVLFSVVDGSDVVVVLLGIVLVSAGCDCVVVVVVVESLDWATAAPIPASMAAMAAMAATADNFF